MNRRLPIIPTIVVAAAVAVMIGLGVWQIQRARWKESLIAKYAEAEKAPPIAFPTVPTHDADLPLFRHATGVCLGVVGQRAVAGENLAGEPGYVHILDCATGAEGPGMAVEVGWSKDPNAKVNWTGGPVTGVIGPDRHSRMGFADCLRHQRSRSPPSSRVCRATRAPPRVRCLLRKRREFRQQS